MLKFNLARKYLVGLLTVAMVMSLFVMPISAQPSPTVNAAQWTVTATPTSGLNPADSGDTHTITIYTKLDGALADPVTATVYVAVAVGNPLVVTSSGNAVTRVSTGVYTYTCTYGTAPIDQGPTTYTFYAYISANGTGLDYSDVISDPVTKTWEVRKLSKLEVINTPTLNNLVTDDKTHTITVYLYDQFGSSITGTITITVSPTEYANPYQGVATSVSSTVFSYTTSRTSTGPEGPDTIVVVTSTGGVTLTTTVYKAWYVPVLTTLTVTPMYAKNNWDVTATHTLTANMYDQYGRAITGTIMWSVSPTIFASPSSETATNVSTDTFTYTTSRNNSGDVGTDIITVTGIAGNQTLTVTASKYWYYTPTITTVVITPTEAKNRINPLNPQPVGHTITIEVLDRYGKGYTGDVTALITVSGVNTITDTVPFTGPSTTWTYTSTKVGTDTITVQIDSLSKTVTKLWGYTETLVAPDYVDLNTTFTVTVYGAPTDTLTLNWWMNPYVGDLVIVTQPTAIGAGGYAVYTFKSPSFATVLGLQIGVHDSLENNTVWLDKKITVQQGGEPPVPPTAVSVTLNLKAGWNMITPGVSSGDSPAAIFGTGFVSIYHWNPVTYSYEVPTILLPGVGYWVKMSVDKTVSISGNPTASPFTKAVNTGWEQIGNPFETDIPWTNVTVTNGSVTKSLVDAKAAGWIGSAYSYNPSTGLYETASYSTGTMYAGKGYWFRVYVPVTLTFTK